MTTDLPPLDEIEPTPFAELFASLAAGVPNKDATAALARVVLAVEELRKPGKVTLEVHVAPEGDSGRNVYITTKVKAAPPEPAAPGSILFHGPGGSVHKRDPYQRQMFAGEDVRDLDADGAPPAREA